MVGSAIPKRGDVFLVDLNPVAGNELRDEHRCIVITPREINAVGICLVVPVTSGGMFARKAGLAVNISGSQTTGVALCNQVRGMDIVARISSGKAKYIETLDNAVVDEIAMRIVSMIDPE